MKAFGDWDYGGTEFWGKYSSDPKKDHYTPCYGSHPALPVGDYKIYGGSCLHPAVKDADIYVGLDQGMDITSRSFPWNPGEEILFPITDMQAPKNPGEFKKLIEWLAQKLREGNKVHVGCIGGHGRTGTVFAALVAHMMPKEQDPIGYVRTNYCKKAVESKVQIDFLVKHFGVKKAEATKVGLFGGHGHKHSTVKTKGSTGLGGFSDHHNGKYVVKELQEVVPVATKGNVWGNLTSFIPVFDKVE